MRMTCNHCGGRMVKRRRTDYAQDGCGCVMVLGGLVAGVVALLVFWPALIAAPVMILMGLVWSVTSGRSYWRCRRCRAVIERR